MTPKQLVSAHEDSFEMGGYFIVNGLEKIIRMLIVQRRNYPMALIRSAFTKRGSSYSNYGVTIRAVRADQTSLGNTLHYLTNGSCNLRFQLNRQV